MHSSKKSYLHEIARHEVPALVRRASAYLRQFTLADGVSVPEVSGLLGHKDSYVTWKVYAHFVRKESQAV
jgi:hypothetical protein